MTCTAIIARLWIRTLGRHRNELSLSRQQQQDLAKEADRWRHEAETYLRGLSGAIDGQLQRWQFTAAEKEVALLLLKGFSTKEIADLRNVSEKTVRQQSTTIYRKSRLSGRSQLAAFFLEDLLAPPNASEGS